MNSSQALNCVRNLSSGTRFLTNRSSEWSAPSMREDSSSSGSHDESSSESVIMLVSCSVISDMSIVDMHTHTCSHLGTARMELDLRNDVTRKCGNFRNMVSAFSLSESSRRLSVDL